MAITAAEIARMCGVSRTTVDRALKNKAGISPNTRRRICEMAKRCDYHPNYLASSLSTGSTRSVGVIVFDLQNPHFARLVNALQQTLADEGVLAYICISGKDKQRELELIEDLLSRCVDGLALVPINFGMDFEARLRSLSIPAVALSNRLNGLPFVGGDNERAAYAGMERFYAHGFRTVHFVCPPMRFRGTENLSAQEERLAGCERFRREHPDMLGETIATADYVERVSGLLRKTSEKTGVFCSSDSFTLRLRRHFLDLGGNLETCCTLMGFDGLDFLEQLTPRPASVCYPAEEIGRRAARLLLDLIHGRPAEREILLPCPLLSGSQEV